MHFVKPNYIVSVEYYKLLFILLNKICEKLLHFDASMLYNFTN